MDSLLCGWASEGVGEAVGRPVDPCWDDEGNDVDAGPQRVEPDEAPTVVVEESDVAALAEEMRKLSEDAIAMKEQMRLLELERLEAHLEAERAARAVSGALCVFCKSGKDRTGMAVTLAAAMFVGEAATAPDDDEALMLDRANALREHGVRVRICEKNTGRKKYAFNVIQREFLPYPYRPPTATIEDLLSSTIHRDTS
ncbi:phosphatidylinositol-3,4-bisphosphate 4-phosphatase [Aureococcus anophagefferens]|uniref:Phosphatidylinositol-3,4-bisphosphate 4-phosphatase n=1 Tax=Aureococcus anophagefferens TaxID=44056 RepID=A0ABR1GFX8_AURAN